MLSLRLLGGTSLLADGEPYSGPAAQRRRLALLAVLALSAGRPVTRDRVIGLLWPDSDAERARHLLSESLYVIRKALGEDAVLVTGDDLRLGPALPCDVREFEEALERGDREAAVRMYAGPALEGFYLPEAADFERWVEGERARLARIHQRALEELAGERSAAGNTAGAVDAWRQLAAEDPFNSRIALSLMRALEAAGDRAGAIQHARVHTLLLREELGAAPDPEVAACADRLRADAPVPPAAGRPAAAEPPRPSSPPAAAAVAAGEAGTPRPVEDATPPVRESWRAPRRPVQAVLLAAGAAVLLLAGAYFVMPDGNPGTGPRALLRTLAPADAGSIAVLPFEDLSPSRDQAWFSSGISVAIIEALSRVDGVRVAAWTSAVAINGKDLDVREIGDRLDVATLLEGSVRHTGDRLRVTVRLVDARTGYQLWSDSYDVDEADVIAMQDGIARAVVARLHPSPGGADTDPLVTAATADVEAYHLYLQGVHLWNRRTPDGLAAGMRRFGEAIARDSGFALPYAGLANSYTLLVTFGSLAPAEGYPRARAAAEAALARKPDLAEAHAALGAVELYHDRNWDGAGRHFRRALELSPGFATGRQWYAHYLACRGEDERALAEIHQAQRLDPLSAAIHTTAGTVHYYARRYDEAAAEFDRALELEPGFWGARLQLGTVRLLQGRTAEALEAAAEAQRLGAGHPLPLAFRGYAEAAAGNRAEAVRILAELRARRREQYVSAAYLAGIHLALGEREEALTWLEQAYAERDDWVVFMGADPVFDGLRDEPGFRTLLERAGHPLGPRPNRTTASLAR